MCKQGTCTSSFGRANDSWFKKLKKGFDSKKVQRQFRRKLERQIARAPA